VTSWAPPERHAVMVARDTAREMSRGLTRQTPGERLDLPAVAGFAAKP
jgi:hypothetical protein